MNAMGQRVELVAKPLSRDYVPAHRQTNALRSHAERLKLAISWNRLAGRLAQAGERQTEVTEAPLDAELLLRALAEQKVDYLLIGGHAVQTHGHVRSTNDAAMIPAPDPLNLERLAAALRQLHAKPLNPGHSESEITADLLPRATLWQFATPNGEIDIAHEVPGGAPFADLMQCALRVRIDDLEVAVVSLDDLIRMKLASGRPIDLAVVAALTDEPPT